MEWTAVNLSSGMTACPPLPQWTNKLGCHSDNPFLGGNDAVISIAEWKIGVCVCGGGGVHQMIGGRGVHQSPGGTTGVPGTKAFGQQVSCFAAAGKKTHLVQCQYGVQTI